MFICLLAISLPVRANKREEIVAINGTSYAAGVAFLASYTPASSVSHLEITIALETASTLDVLWSGVEHTFNKNVAIPANQLHTFTFGVNKRGWYDFNLGTTSVLYITITEVHQR